MSRMSGRRVDCPSVRVKLTSAGTREYSALVAQVRETPGLINDETEALMRDRREREAQ